MNGLNHTGYIGLFKEFKRIHKWESSTCSFAWILTTSYMFILITTCMFESVLSLLSTVTLLNRIQYMYSKMHSYQNHRCPRHILRFVHTLCFPFSWSPTLLIELTITKNQLNFTSFLTPKSHNQEVLFQNYLQIWHLYCRPNSDIQGYLDLHLT